MLFIQGAPGLEAAAWRVDLSRHAMNGCPKSIAGLCTDRCFVSLAQPVLRCLSSHGARAIALEGSLARRISADRIFLLLLTPMLPPFCLFMNSWVP